jgi:hypothetical protein
MKRKVLLVVVCAFIAALLSLPAWSQGDTAKKIAVAKAENVLEPIGNKVAPLAAGKITFNIAGKSLDFVLYAEKLVPLQSYTLTSCDCTLATGKADKDGNLILGVSVTDAKILKKISDDPMRKFDLWQNNQRLTRSADFYQFTYTPAQN